jgi:hypothetical protein
MGISRVISGWGGVSIVFAGFIFVGEITLTGARAGNFSKLVDVLFVLFVIILYSAASIFNLHPRRGYRASNHLGKVASPLPVTQGRALRPLTPEPTPKLVDGLKLA